MFFQQLISQPPSHCVLKTHVKTDCAPIEAFMPKFHERPSVLVSFKVIIETSRGELSQWNVSQPKKIETHFQNHQNVPQIMLFYLRYMLVPQVHGLRTPSQPFNLQPLFQKRVEKWFQKSGSSNLDFFFQSTTFLLPEKNVDLLYKTTFFLVNHFSRTRFLDRAQSR